MSRLDVCDCSIDAGDFDHCDFFKTKIIKARKEHKCIECKEIIKKGDIYENNAGMWDGYFARHKTCMPCVQTRELYCPGGFIYGELRQTIWECCGVDYITGEIAEWKKDEGRENSF